MGNLNRITYPKIFWLFIFGSLLGVLIEGLWCLMKYGHWETHVVTVFEPLCVIYGLGMSGCYIGSVLLESRGFVTKFLVFALIGTVVEFAAGFILEYGLNMKAWDYSDSFMNIKGYISVGMTLVWGILGLAFSYAVPFLEKIFDKIQSKPWNIACAVLSIFLVVDIAVSAACFIRWSKRHEGILPSNTLERIIDDTYNDSFMKKRFCEWEFID
ncbi:MAG: putative ABC transporter permease [Acutalibacteraceae bacterium]